MERWKVDDEVIMIEYSTMVRRSDVLAYKKMLRSPQCIMHWYRPVKI